MHHSRFSVVLGSTRCRGSSGGLASFVPEAGLSKGAEGILPQDNFKIGLYRMQFPEFPGPEFVKQEGL